MFGQRDVDRNEIVKVGEDRVGEISTIEVHIANIGVKEIDSAEVLTCEAEIHHDDAIVIHHCGLERSPGGTADHATAKFTIDHEWNGAGIGSWIDNRAYIRRVDKFEFRTRATLDL